MVTDTLLKAPANSCKGPNSDQAITAENQGEKQDKDSDKAKKTRLKHRFDIRYLNREMILDVSWSSL